MTRQYKHHAPGEKRPPCAPPSSVVDPDIGTPDPPRVGEEILGINTETQGCLTWKMTEEVQEGELWTVDWWDDVREDRSKSEEEVRPFEESGWWYRIIEKTCPNRFHHCQNTSVVCFIIHL